MNIDLTDSMSLHCYNISNVYAKFLMNNNMSVYHDYRTQEYVVLDAQGNEVYRLSYSQLRNMRGK